MTIKHMVNKNHISDTLVTYEYRGVIFLKSGKKQGYHCDMYRIFSNSIDFGVAKSTISGMKDFIDARLDNHFIV